MKNKNKEKEEWKLIKRMHLGELISFERSLYLIIGIGLIVGAVPTIFSYYSFQDFRYLNVTGLILNFFGAFILLYHVFKRDYTVTKRYRRRIVC